MFKSYLAVTIVTASLCGIPYAHAGVLKPSALEVTVPEATADEVAPYTDDIYLKSLTFDGKTFNSDDQVVAISRIEVLTGRESINSEWGDNDNASDGDDNPFVKAGFDPAAQETTDPVIQDATLLNTFNSLSLTEMSDGEGGRAFSFRTIFTESLIDNDPGPDDIPELVLIERGLNDDFDVRLITGGTFDAPIYSNWFSTSSRDYFRTGIQVDTMEISRPQEIGVGGYDLNSFLSGTPSGPAQVFGFELRTSKSGPDLNGFFLTAEESSNFRPPLSAGVAPVPLPAPVLLLGAGLAFLFRVGRRQV